MMRKVASLPIEIILFVCSAMLLAGFLAIVCLATRKDK